MTKNDKKKYDGRKLQHGNSSLCSVHCTVDKACRTLMWKWNLMWKENDTKVKDG